MSIVQVPVEYSQYWISVDDGSPDIESVSDIAVGLAAWQTGEVIVTAAHQDKTVDVEVLQLDGPPKDAADDEWQDVVEFSLTTATGKTRLLPLSLVPKGPNLTDRGPGTYRFRLSATDRDPVAGASSSERHRLEIWPAPHSAPRVIRMTSEFAAAWATPPPGPRLVDWNSLGSTVGTRLIVRWWDMAPPPSEPQPKQVVSVSEVLSGSPAKVFHRFDHTNPGGLARGGGGGSTHFIVGPFWGRGQDSASNEHISSLELHVTQIEVTRFSRLRFTWGFAENRKELVPTAPGEPFRTRDVKPRRHPLPVDSIQVEMTFTKHPDGRLVTATMTAVPAWLTADVAALWRLVLAGRRTDDQQDWPWLEYVH